MTKKITTSARKRKIYLMKSLVESDDFQKSISVSVKNESAVMNKICPS